MNLIPENSLDKKLVKVSGYLGFISHLAYYFTWVYWIPQPYDSFWLRLSCSLISVPLILIDYWPKKIDPLFRGLLASVFDLCFDHNLYLFVTKK
jgi:hypothetical protein